VDGVFRTGADPEFQGHGVAASARPAALAAWWRGAVGAAGAVDQFSLEADLDLRSGEQTFENIKATTGEGTITGVVELRGFRESGERYADVSLKADRADLVEARALTELLTGNPLTTGLRNMTVSLVADTLIAGGAEAREVVLEGSVESGRLDLRRLAVADLAGAKLALSGKIADPFEDPEGSVEGSVEAADLSGAAEFLSRLLPESRLLGRLREIAPALSPVRAELSASAGLENQPIALALNGSFADTHLSLDAEGQGELADPKTLTGTIKLNVSGEDSATVLSQLGFRAVPVRVGPLELETRFEGALASAGKLNVNGRVAGIDLEYAAESSLIDGQLSLAGTFDAQTDDMDPALLLAGIAAPGMGEGHSLAAKGQLNWRDGRLAVVLDDATLRDQPVTGAIEAKFGEGLELTGSLALHELSLPMLAAFALGHVPKLEADGWSETTFAAALPANVSLQLDLGSEVLDLGLPEKGGKAALRIGYSKQGFDLDLAHADFAGGALKGAARGGLRGGEVQLSVRGALHGGALQALAWRRAGTPVASGLVDISVDASGRGRSMAGLVSSITGSGSLGVRDSQLNGINSAALAAVARLAEAEDEPQDDQGREIFATQFNAGTLEFGSAAASLTIEGGIVETGTVSVETGNTAVLAEASVDLKTLSLTSNWTIRALEQGVAEDQQPFVRLVFTGPVTRPERQVDLRPLLDLVQTRRMQKQLDELDRLQREQRAEPTGALPSPSQTKAMAAGSDNGGGVLPDPASQPPAIPAAEAPPDPPQQPPDLLRSIRPAVREMLRGG
jgi:hypothetical protein